VFGNAQICEIEGDSTLWVILGREVIMEILD
jgi:hypothetical protein